MLHFNFKKTALLTFSLLLHPAFVCAEASYAPLNDKIVKASAVMDSFFSKKNAQNLIFHIDEFKNLVQELKTVKTNISKTDNSKYTKKICFIGDTVIEKLENVIVVLEKNKKTKPLFAIKVAIEIKKACNVTELFKTVRNELIELLHDAKREKNIPVAKEIHALLITLSKVDELWQDPSHQEKHLIDGLTHRMKQR